MAPPSYGDLGKAARDLFSKGFSEYTCITFFQLNAPIIYVPIGLRSQSYS